MTKRSSLILLELMAALLFFALAGSVCISILVKADSLSRTAAASHRGIQASVSAAELIRGADSTQEARAALLAAFPGSSGEETVAIPLEEGRLTVTRQDSGLLTLYNIVYSCPGEQDFCLNVQRYFREVEP